MSAFHTINDTMENASLLVHQTPEAPTCLMVDAPVVAVGAAFHQFIDAEWRALAFFSKTLKPTEHKHSAFDRELLVVYLNINHFHHLFEARQFSVRIDSIS